MSSRAERLPRRSFSEGGRDLTNTGHVTQVGEILCYAQDDIVCCFFQAARTSASRSAARPAFNLACRSADCDLNHASVSRAVSASGRNVRPFANARLMFVRAIPLSAPVHTGISDHGAT